MPGGDDAEPNCESVRRISLLAAAPPSPIPAPRAVTSTELPSPAMGRCGGWSRGSCCSTVCMASAGAMCAMEAKPEMGEPEEVLGESSG